MLITFLYLFMVVACNQSSNAHHEDKTIRQPRLDDETSITIRASKWKFDRKNYTVPAGEITIYLKNEDGFHGIQVEGTDVKIEGDGSETVVLTPGEYTIYCNIICGTGHDDMISTLIVE